MKQLLLILSIALLTIGCSTEPEPKRYSWDDLGEGAGGIYFLDDGSLAASDGEPVTGVVDSGYINAQFWSEGNLKDGGKDGLWRGWYENGQLKLESNYKDGRITGKLKRWFEDGRIMYETEFVSGTGVDKSYYQNGQLAGEENYIDGKQHGLSRWWHDDGQLALEVTFLEGYEKDGRAWNPIGEPVGFFIPPMPEEIALKYQCP